EIARLGLLAQRHHVQISLCEQSRGSAIGDPTAHADRRWERSIAWKQAVLGRIRIDYHVPRVAGWPGGVDNQHSSGAAPLRFLVLIGPAAVVRHRLPAKEIWLGRRGWRIVDENEKNLAANVGAFEVVP